MVKKRKKEKMGSPCDLDHLGFKGLHMLQKGLHGLSCVNYGLREGKSKGKVVKRDGCRMFKCRSLDRNFIFLTYITILTKN